MSEIIEKNFKDFGISPINLYNHANSYFIGGQLMRHSIKSKHIKADELSFLLYVDDKTGIFFLKSDAILDSNITFHQIARLEVSMYIGRN